MVRLLVTLAAGAVVAVLVTITVSNALSGVANGVPTNQSLYNYGSR